MRERFDRGFTLTDLLIAIAALVIMIAVAMPLFNTIMAQRRLADALTRVANDLRYAQSIVVNQGGLIRFHWGSDPGVGIAGAYRLEQSADGGATWIGLGNWYQLSADYQGASVTAVKDSTGSGTTVYEVRFNSQGAAVNPGAVTYPIIITVTTATGSGTVQVMRIGSVRIP